MFFGVIFPFAGRIDQEGDREQSLEELQDTEAPKSYVFGGKTVLGKYFKTNLAIE